MIRRCAWIALICAAACRGELEKLPATEILVRLDASDEVRALAQRVRLGVSVQPSADGGWVERAGRSIVIEASGVDAGWPIDLPLIPHDARQLPWRFEIVADAFDEDGAVLAQQRAISSFSEGSQRVLPMWLAFCGERGAVCEADADCHGVQCDACRDGLCQTETPITPSSALLTIDDSRRVPMDAGPTADSSPTAPPAQAHGPDRTESGPDASAAESGAGPAPDAAGGDAPQPSVDASEPTASDPAATNPQPPEPLSWSPLTALESGRAGVTHLSVAHNRAGHVVVAWWQAEVDGYLWLRRFVDGKWDDAPLRISADPPAGNFVWLVGLGLDRTDEAQLFYHAKSQCHWLQWRGEASIRPETAPLVTGDPTACAPFVLAVDEAAGATALWGAPLAMTADASALGLSQNVFDASQWGSPTSLGTLNVDAETPWTAVTSPSGWFLAPFFQIKGDVDAGDADVYVRTLVGRARDVMAPEPLQFAEPLTTYPEYAIDDLGHATLIAFQYDAASGADEIHASGFTPESKVWSPPLRLSTANASVAVFNLTIAPSPQPDATPGSAIAAWFERASTLDPAELVIARHDANGWAPERFHAEPELDLETDMALAANSAGDVVVVWGVRSTPKVLYHMRYVKSRGWSRPGIVSMYTGDVVIQEVTLDADGHAIVLLTKRDPGSELDHLVWSSAR